MARYAPEGRYPAGTAAREKGIHGWTNASTSCHDLRNLVFSTEVIKTGDLLTVDGYLGVVVVAARQGVRAA